MNITKIAFSELPMLAKTDRAYAENDPLLRPFYKYEMIVDNFLKVIADKKNDHTDRKTLTEVLNAQYKNLEPFEVVRQNISSLLSENTFTVTTAHQPSLLLGPLYFVYKIFSVIRLTELLNEKFSDNKFVPVFVIGGEDHDFEEVNNITLFGKKLEWQKSENTDGAVGMMQTESLKPVLEDLKKILGDSEQAQQVFEKIEKAYTSHALYQDATQDLLNALFGKYGLVVVQMNDKTLKHLFIPVMEREIIEQPSKKFVQDAQDKLEAIGFKPQAFARDINLFYMRENLRERIVKSENGSFTLELRKKTSDLEKSTMEVKTWANQEEIIAELHAHPEFFSPNVVLRPLYQEMILPNLAYVGGGGELAYWLERKEQFEYFGINFPMLIRRNSVLWLDKTNQDKLEKLKVSLTNLTVHPDTLTKNYITKNASQPLNFDAKKVEFGFIYDKIAEYTKTIDASLEKTVLAEKAKQLQGIESIEARLIKAEKQRHETVLTQIRALQQKLFPNQGLQERSDNFLPIYLKNGDAFFEVLKENLNPLESGMIVIYES